MLPYIMHITETQTQSIVRSTNMALGNLASVSVIATFSVLSPLSRVADNATNLGRTSAALRRPHSLRPQRDVSF